MMSLPALNTKGKVTIPVINKKVPKIIAAVVVFGGLAGLYMLMKKRGAGPGNLRVVDIAPEVDYVIVPNEVRPDSFVTVSGTFMDENKKPVITRGTARYVVFESDTTNEREVVATGLIGSMVSTFSVRIPTTSFKTSEYEIKITDLPPTADEIGTQLSTGPGPQGTGASGIQRNQSISATPGFGITVS